MFMEKFFSKIHTACHNIAKVIQLIKPSVLARDVNVGLSRFHHCLYSCAEPAWDSHLENHKVSLEKLVRVPLEKQLDPSGWSVLLSVKYVDE